jgi:hypothetical protein
MRPPFRRFAMAIHLLFCPFGSASWFVLSPKSIVFKTPNRSAKSKHSKQPFLFIRGGEVIKSNKTGIAESGLFGLASWFISLPKNSFSNFLFLCFAFFFGFLVWRKKQTLHGFTSTRRCFQHRAMQNLW